MFPHDYFGGIFTPDYFPPVETTPIVPPVVHPYGHRRRNEPIPPGWPIDLDGEELMFWIL